MKKHTKSARTYWSPHGTLPHTQSAAATDTTTGRPTKPQLQTAFLDRVHGTVADLALVPQPIFPSPPCGALANRNESYPFTLDQHSTATDGDDNAGDGDRDHHDGSATGSDDPIPQLGFISPTWRSPMRSTLKGGESVDAASSAVNNNDNYNGNRDSHSGHSGLSGLSGLISSSVLSGSVNSDRPFNGLGSSRRDSTSGPPGRSGGRHRSVGSVYSSNSGNGGRGRKRGSRKESRSPSLFIPEALLRASYVSRRPSNISNGGPGVGAGDGATGPRSPRAVRLLLHSIVSSHRFSVASATESGSTPSTTLPMVALLPVSDTSDSQLATSDISSDGKSLNSCGSSDSGSAVSAPKLDRHGFPCATASPGAGIAEGATAPPGAGLSVNSTDFAEPVLGLATSLQWSSPGTSQEPTSGGGAPESHTQLHDGGTGGGILFAPSPPSTRSPPQHPRPEVSDASVRRGGVLASTPGIPDDAVLVDAARQQFKEHGFIAAHDRGMPGSTPRSTTTSPPRQRKPCVEWISQTPDHQEDEGRTRHARRRGSGDSRQHQRGRTPSPARRSPTTAYGRTSPQRSGVSPQRARNGGVSPSSRSISPSSHSGRPTSPRAGSGDHLHTVVSLETKQAVYARRRELREIHIEREQRVEQRRVLVPRLANLTRAAMWASIIEAETFGFTFFTVMARLSQLTRVFQRLAPVMRLRRARGRIAAESQRLLRTHTRPPADAYEVDGVMRLLPRTVLDRISEAATPRRFHPKEAMMYQDTAGDASCFYVAAGQVEVLVRRGGISTVVATIGPNVVVGSIAMITGASRIATVRAKTSVVTWECSRAHLLALLSDKDSETNSSGETGGGAESGAKAKKRRGVDRTPKPDDKDGARKNRKELGDAVEAAIAEVTQHHETNLMAVWHGKFTAADIGRFDSFMNVPKAPLMSLRSTMVTKIAHPGKVLLARGECPSEAFVLLRGTVRLFWPKSKPRPKNAFNDPASFLEALSEVLDFPNNLQSGRNAVLRKVSRRHDLNTSVTESDQTGGLSLEASFAISHQSMNASFGANPNNASFNGNASASTAEFLHGSKLGFGRSATGLGKSFFDRSLSPGASASMRHAPPSEISETMGDAPKRTEPLLQPEVMDGLPEHARLSQTSKDAAPAHQSAVVKAVALIGLMPMLLHEVSPIDVVAESNCEMFVINRTLMSRLALHDAQFIHRLRYNMLSMQGPWVTPPNPLHVIAAATSSVPPRVRQRYSKPPPRWRFLLEGTAVVLDVDKIIHFGPATEQNVYVVIHGELNTDGTGPGSLWPPLYISFFGDRTASAKVSERLTAWQVSRRSLIKLLRSFGSLVADDLEHTLDSQYRMKFSAAPAFMPYEPAPPATGASAGASPKGHASGARGTAATDVEIHTPPPIFLNDAPLSDDVSPAPAVELVSLTGAFAQSHSPSSRTGGPPHLIGRLNTKSPAGGQDDTASVNPIRAKLQGNVLETSLRAGSASREDDGHGQGSGAAGLPLVLPAVKDSTLLTVSGALGGDGVPAANALPANLRSALKTEARPPDSPRRGKKVPARGRQSPPSRSLSPTSAKQAPHEQSRGQPSSTSQIFRAGKSTKRDGVSVGTRDGARSTSPVRFSPVGTSTGPLRTALVVTGADDASADAINSCHDRDVKVQKPPRAHHTKRHHPHDEHNFDLESEPDDDGDTASDMSARTPESCGPGASASTCSQQSTSSGHPQPRPHPPPVVGILSPKMPRFTESPTTTDATTETASTAAHLPTTPPPSAVISAQSIRSFANESSRPRLFHPTICPLPKSTDPVLPPQAITATGGGAKSFGTSTLSSTLRSSSGAKPPLGSLLPVTAANTTTAATANHHHHHHHQSHSGSGFTPPGSRPATSGAATSRLGGVAGGRLGSSGLSRSQGLAPHKPFEVLREEVAWKPTTARDRGTIAGHDPHPHHHQEQVPHSHSFRPTHRPARLSVSLSPARLRSSATASAPGRRAPLGSGPHSQQSTSRPHTQQTSRSGRSVRPAAAPPNDTRVDDDERSTDVIHAVQSDDHVLPGLTTSMSMSRPNTSGGGDKPHIWPPSAAPGPVLRSLEVSAPAKRDKLPRAPTVAVDSSSRPNTSGASTGRRDGRPATSHARIVSASVGQSDTKHETKTSYGARSGAGPPASVASSSTGYAAIARMLAHPKFSDKTVSQTVSQKAPASGEEKAEGIQWGAVVHTAMNGPHSTARLVPPPRPTTAETSFGFGPPARAASYGGGPVARISTHAAALQENKALRARSEKISPGGKAPGTRDRRRRVHCLIGCDDGATLVAEPHSDALPFAGAVFTSAQSNLAWRSLRRS